eukprot:1145986-Pelagomonas_calceolata.AAC.3
MRPQIQQNVAEEQQLGCRESVHGTHNKMMLALLQPLPNPVHTSGHVRHFASRGARVLTLFSHVLLYRAEQGMSMH